METIDQRVLHVFSSVFGREIAADATRETTGEWTSLRHLQVVLGLEEEFEIEFDLEALQDLQSVKEFTAAVQQQLQG